MTTIATADLYDERGDELDALALQLHDIGGHVAFHGPVRTVRCHRDNALVKATLATAGEGAVLVVVVIVGALIGESIGFWLGRWLGPRIRFSRLGVRIGEHNWARSELYLRRRGGPAIFLSRFLPVLHSLVPLTVGMSGFAYRRFLAWTAPACTIWAIAYVGAGAAAAGTYRELADRLHYAGYLFVAIIVVFLALAYVAKRIIVRGEARHMRHETSEEPDSGSSSPTGMGD